MAFSKPNPRASTSKSAPNVLSSLTASNPREKGLIIAKRVIIGNTVNALEAKDPNGHTHRWTMYLKPYRPNESMARYVKEVHFKLHDSYDNPIRIVTSPPYEVTETGNREFDVVITAFFDDAVQRPVALNHFLKLFKTPVADPARAVQNVGVAEGCAFEKNAEIIFREPTLLMAHALWDVQPTVIVKPKKKPGKQRMKELREMINRLNRLSKPSTSANAKKCRPNGKN